MSKKWTVLYLIDMENLKPVIQPGSSDSAALDSVFELLNISGQSAPLAKVNVNSRCMV